MAREKLHQDVYWVAETLFVRGWTKAAISRLLGVSDSQVGRMVDPAQKERSDASSAKTAARRQAAYRKRFPKKASEASRRYLRSEAGRLSRRNSESKRRSQMSDGIGITADQFEDKWVGQNGLCAYCGCEMTREGDYQALDYCTIDHVVPLSRGGKHDHGNMVLCCRSCNSKKKDKLDV